MEGGGSARLERDPDDTGLPQCLEVRLNFRRHGPDGTATATMMLDETGTADVRTRLF